MSITGARITKAAFLVLAVISMHFHVLSAFSSEDGATYGKPASGLIIESGSVPDNHGSRVESAWSLTYSVNSLLETEVDSPFFPVNPAYAVSGFGFGDTELSAEFSILAESSNLPGIITQASAIIPVDFSIEGAVSQIHELEHTLGLRKHLSFMSLQTSIGYITQNDQISGQRFDRNFTYALEVNVPDSIGGITYGLELSGDLSPSDDEYPVFIKTCSGFEPIPGIELEWGIELGINDPEIANIIFGMSFSI